MAATRRRGRTRAQRLSRSAGEALSRGTRATAEVAHRFSRHRLFVFTSAMAFRTLVSLVPLTLLALGLLGALGQQKVWRDTLAPAVEDRFTRPVYHAIDTSVEKILSSGSAVLIAYASILLFWNLAATVSVVVSALNAIHDVEERRSLRRRAVVFTALALAIGLCVIGAMLVVALVGRVDAGSVATAVLAVVKWGAAVGLLGLAVGLLVRYAPAERPKARWAGAGSLLIVASWIVTSLAFRWWVTAVANFESAIGQLTFFLLLTAYVFAACAIFLVGVELDEVVREEARE